MVGRLEGESSQMQMQVAGTAPACRAANSQLRRPGSRVPPQLTRASRTYSRMEASVVTPSWPASLPHTAANAPAQLRRGKPTRLHSLQTPWQHTAPATRAAHVVHLPCRRRRRVRIPGGCCRAGPAGPCSCNAEGRQRRWAEGGNGRRRQAAAGGEQGGGGNARHRCISSSLTTAQAAVRRWWEALR